MAPDPLQARSSRRARCFLRTLVLARPTAQASYSLSAAPLSCLLCSPRTLLSGAASPAQLGLQLPRASPVFPAPGLQLAQGGFLCRPCVRPDLRRPCSSPLHPAAPCALLCLAMSLLPASRKLSSSYLLCAPLFLAVLGSSPARPCAGRVLLVQLGRDSLPSFRAPAIATSPVYRPMLRSSSTSSPGR
ncbi:uncharacterized protein LOC100193272 [Zea mays]|uniref:Uncharacterized protein n=1 Tax=Zea mays TaxID=4577 RepID=B4FEF7_MAIZE|nr:uncharacterized protein LOC100193272 [Zea mays]ACF80500.1 unknown [Zea mays]|eukprot:NP_001131891.1 uncharacterized protein LOC100193272 [Zea mays]